MKPSGAKDGSAARPDPAEAPKPDDALRARIKLLEEERDRLKAELGDARDRFLRTRADYDNLVRRTQKDSVEAARNAKGHLLLRFTTVVETLERAVTHLEGAVPETARGVRLALEDARKILKDESVKEIDTSGAFNYRLHQAVESVETTQKPEGTILEVVQRGYLLADEVLRPALVRVASPPKAKPASKDTAAGTAT